VSAPSPSNVARDSILLVPADRAQDGTLVPRTGTGPDGRPLLWAFTDLEALTAWDHAPAEAALAVAGSDLVASAAPVLLNPAGSGPAPVRRAARERFDAGLAAAADGDLTTAIELLQEALDACGELGDRLHGADVARALARCHDERGDEAHARRLREQSADVFDTLGEGELAAATRPLGLGSA
jgi:hypothetical protein